MNHNETSTRPRLRSACRSIRTSQRFVRYRSLIIGLGACMVAAGSGSASELESYKREVAAFGSIQRSGTTSTGMVGGQFGNTIFKQFGYFTEASYGRAFGQKWLMFGSGLTVNVPTPVKHLVPYVGMQAGVARQGPVSLKTELLPAASADAQSMLSAYRLTYGATMGARWYIRPHWGLKPDVRWQRYRGDGVGKTLSLGMGLFFRFGH